VGGVELPRSIVQHNGLPVEHPENAVHIPAACISGETANQGGPWLVTLSWISATCPWSAPFIDDT
jgi:hypothetical protein